MREVDRDRRPSAPVRGGAAAAATPSTIATATTAGPPPPPRDASSAPHRRGWIRRRANSATIAIPAPSHRIVRAPSDRVGHGHRRGREPRGDRIRMPVAARVDREVVRQVARTLVDLQVRRATSASFGIQFERLSERRSCIRLPDAHVALLEDRALLVRVRRSARRPAAASPGRGRSAGTRRPGSGPAAGRPRVRIRSGTHGLGVGITTCTGMPSPWTRPCSAARFALNFVAMKIGLRWA